MKNKKLLLISTVAVIIVLAVVFGPGMFTGADPGGLDNWRTQIVNRRDIGSSVLATGIVKPKVGAEVRVGSRVSGIVRRLHVKVGDHVEKDQLLGELDPTEYRARVNQASAALQNARVQLEFAVLNRQRRQALKKKNFTSQLRVDEAEKAYGVARAMVKQARANLDYARVQLNYTQVRAPISGVIATVSTQEGETVAAGFTAPTFVVIIDLERLEVRAYVDETDIGRISTQQRATFTVDTYPGTEFEGEVTAIYPGAEMKDNVVNYIAIIDIQPAPGFTLRPEMTTTAHIYQESRQDVLAVPRIALKREQGKKCVYVLKGNKRNRRWVKAGWSDGKYIEIIDGLNEGETVITGKKEG